MTLLLALVAVSGICAIVQSLQRNWRAAVAWWAAFVVFTTAGVLLLQFWNATMIRVWNMNPPATQPTSAPVPPVSGG